MIKTINSGELTPRDLERSAASAVSGEVRASVAAIIADVRERGDAALLDLCERFDGFRPSELRVSGREMEEALESTDAYFMDTLKLAAANIRAYHERQLDPGYEFSGGEGVIMGRRVIPIERVGLYVPGGTASYPSTVLMDAIPAKIAGVERLVMCTPAGKDGRVAPAILAAAHVAGVDEIYKIGGAQAVAAMAYGTESVPKVYKIVGPGNIFVAEAKRAVFGAVDIDMIAGPSDVLVIADESANAVYVAADMLAQAEHDVRARAVLITDCGELAGEVAREIEKQLEPLQRRDIARASIESGGLIIISRSVEEAIELANIIAPEHLELAVKEPMSRLSAVKNAGSVFVGEFTPEALGDYMAGPNHTLPTMGTARFASHLSVDDFVKKSSYLSYSCEALSGIGARIVDFAEHEGLGAHAQSIKVRMDEK